MTATKIILASVIGDPQLGTYNPLDFVKNDDLTSPLFAAYLHGTDYHAGRDSTPLTDLSGHGRTLTQVGSTVGATEGTQAKGFFGNINKYLTTPFTFDQLAAAGAVNEFHALTFLKSPITPGANANGRPIDASHTGSGNARRALLTVDAAFNSSSTIWDDTQVRQAGLGNPPPAWRDTDYFMSGFYATLAGVGAVTGHDGGTIVDTFAAWISSAGTRQIGGPVARLGGSAQGAFNKVQTATLFFDRRLSVVETQAVYDGMRALLADFAVVV